MEPFRYHVYACDQRKPEGAPACTARGSLAVIDALRREIGAARADAQVTTCGSLGLCTRGPNLVVYPEGIWYSGVTVADVPEIVREHLVGGRPVARLVNHEAPALRKEIDENRERMLAAQKAREEAGEIPDDLQTLARAFQESRVLLTAVELDLFTQVGEGATAAEAGKRSRTDARGAAALLHALVALGLLTKDGETFRNTPAAARYLVAGGKDDARLAILHSAALWVRWSHLSDSVRSGMPAARDDSSGLVAAFIGAMHRNAAARAPDLVATIGANGVRRLLDIGGGSGAYAIAFARAAPDLTAEVLDRPEVLPITRRTIEAAGLSARIGTRAGDLRSDGFGEGYDLVLLSAICHMLGPDENRDLLRRAVAALVPGGRLVIQDHVLEESRTAPRAGALFALNMLVSTAAGGTYTAREYTDWMTGAGLVDVQRLRLRGPTSVMLGRRA